MRMRDWIILTGNANRPLAQKVSEKLGKPLAEAEVRRFSDGEIFVEIKENVRGRDTYIIQSTCGPANDNLMELLIMIDALRRASAKEINVIIPYYGYARQDRKVAPRTPITAKLVANLLTTAGATRVVAMDLHAGQIQGFFDLPFDNIFSMPVILKHIRENFSEKAKPEELVIVSPDAGGMERARAYAKRLNASVAMIDKRRSRPNEAQVMNIVGDVQGKTAILVDDMIDTGGTLVQGAEAIMDQGAREVYACATHGVFSGPAIERISKSRLKQVIVTDTIPLSETAQACPKIKQLTVAELIAEAMFRIHNYDSLSKLFV